MTANGTTEEATENVCDLDMFVQVQLLAQSPSRMGETSRVKTDNHILPWCCPGRASNRPTRPKLWMTRSRHEPMGDQEQHVDTELPEWLLPTTEGFTRGSSSSDRRLSS